MTDELASLSFEDAMRELESIVRDLETGKAKLDDALKTYDRDALRLSANSAP
jgi:exodeoxyribonuclease VII small subunit